VADPEPYQQTGVRPVLIDIVLAILVAGAISLAISAKVEPEALDPDVWAYLLANGLGALMLVRRRWPAGVLIVTTLALFGYYLAGYPAVGVAVPIAGAVFSAAEQGRVRLAIAVSASVLVLSTAYRLTEEPAARLLGFEAAQNLVLLVAVIALGDSLRSRRQLRRQSLQQAEQARIEHERTARQQLEQERLRIAREVHDVLAHSVSAISIQSVVGLEALPDEPANAAAALQHIRASSTQALNELRSTLGVLRDPGPPAAEPVGGLADLDRLVATAAGSGLEVSVIRTGTAAAVPVIVDAAAHRIVQESITNVLRHSTSGFAVIEIDYFPQLLELRITDHGGGNASRMVNDDPNRENSTEATDSRAFEPGGFGIAGMRERAELLGGELRAEPIAGGGFEVAAVLPFARRDVAGTAAVSGVTVRT
jgi:signal transduction histidine kinase